MILLLPIHPLQIALLWLLRPFGATLLPSGLQSEYVMMARQRQDPRHRITAGGQRGGRPRFTAVPPTLTLVP